MVNEMNAAEEPEAFKALQKYLQDTFNLSVVDSITIIGKIHKLIRKEVKKTQDAQKPPTIDYKLFTDEEICGLCDYDVL